ncbi:MAG: lytic murein transglycosylase B [Gammaproteobacteria bacterium]
MFLLIPVLSLLAGTGCAEVSTHGYVQRNNYLDQPDVRTFIDKMVKEYDFSRDDLDRLFAQAKEQTRVLSAIASPAEAKPWYDYRPIFLTSRRIDQGVTFWDQNATTLQEASQLYGVPPEIIVAIIGVESFYGRRMGGFPVFDTLVTLSFDYPPRAAFFRRQLAQYLVLTREEHIDPLTPKGSYAGAMGRGQFMPSSYREYAVDFDTDGKRDLWHSSADAIGSVANYFKRHGWEQGMPVAVPANLDGNVSNYQALLDSGVKPSISLSRLEQQGAHPTKPFDFKGDVSLFALEGQMVPEYWIGTKNFYVITRYNHSKLYAMAVYQLAEAIKEQYQQAHKDSNKKPEGNQG